MQEGQLAFAKQAQGFHLAQWEQIPDLGLYMDQVVTYMERMLRPLLGEGERVLTPSMVNNYVKMGIVSRPVGKKYGRDQLAQLFMVSVLKQMATAEEMKPFLRVPQDATFKEIYEAFCITFQEVFGEIAATIPLPSPMECALKAAAYRLLLSATMEERQETAAMDKPVASGKRGEVEKKGSS